MGWQVLGPGGGGLVGGCRIRRIPRLIKSTLVKKRKATQKEQPGLLLLPNCTCNLCTYLKNHHTAEAGVACGFSALHHFVTLFRGWFLLSVWVSFGTGSLPSWVLPDRLLPGGVCLASLHLAGMVLVGTLLLGLWQVMPFSAVFGLVGLGSGACADLIQDLEK
jgi:hypothetical protein